MTVVTVLTTFCDRCDRSRMAFCVDVYAHSVVFCDFHPDPFIILKGVGGVTNSDEPSSDNVPSVDVR